MELKRREYGGGIFIYIVKHISYSKWRPAKEKGLKIAGREVRGKNPHQQGQFYTYRLFL